MSELLSQIWTPQMQAAFTVVIVLLVILYVLSIVWVVRDAYLRGAAWYVWAIVALVPILLPAPSAHAPHRQGRTRTGSGTQAAGAHEVW